MRKRIIQIITIVASGVLILSGCYKTATVINNAGQAVTKQVSFSKDVVPIFAGHCTSSGCHNSGGHVPDLTADRAYTSLVNGHYVNVNAPEQSEIYLWLTGQKTPAMPMGGPSNPSNLNNIILAWIKQGAKNN